VVVDPRGALDECDAVRSRRFAAARLLVRELGVDDPAVMEAADFVGLRA
jgi:hypothetical protein